MRKSLLQRRFSLFSVPIAGDDADSMVDFASAFLMLREQQMEWNLTDLQLEHASTLIALDKQLATVKSNESIRFLYSKSLFPNLPTKQRIDLLTQNKSVLQRVQRLLALKTMLFLDRPQFQLNGYSTFPLFTEKFVEIVQTNNEACSMYAPLVFARYVTGQRLTHLPQYLIQQASGSVLERLLFQNQGVNSHDFLQQLFPTIELLPPEQVHHNVLERIQTRPALVSQVSLTPEFWFDSQQWKHGTITSRLLPTKHSLVLVGCTPGGELLLQNWWANKPFVQVSWEFLLHVKAQVRFPKDTVNQVDPMEQGAKMRFQDLDSSEVIAC